MTPLDEAIAVRRSIVVIRASHIADPPSLVSACIAADCRVVEMTLTASNALDAIAQTASYSDAFVGAGTVCRPDQAVAAIAAGAKFLVGPTCDDGVAGVACEAGVPYIPGALTPTEIAKAVALGVYAVKIFPARVFGAGYLRDLAGPMPELRSVVSGGVDAGNVADYLEAGAWAVCPGGSVVAASAIQSGDSEAVRNGLWEFCAAMPGGVERRPA